MAAAPTVTPVVLAADWERLAGPDALGRNLVVRPGDTAPAPWADAPRVVVQDPDDPLATDDLRAARAQRRRVVIELDCELPPPDPVLAIDYWHLSPRPIWPAR